MAKESTYSFLTLPEGGDRLRAVDMTGSTPTTKQLTIQKLHGFNPGIATGRLTLTSGTPITTSDVSGASAATIFYTPTELGDRISLYNTTDLSWDLYPFAETSLNISGLAANTTFDIYAYPVSGVLTLEAVAWTSDTARTVPGAISRQNGAWIKTSDGRRLLGSFRTVAAGQCADSILTRYLCNIYNRVSRYLNVQDATTTWNYTGAFRQARAIAANRVQLIAALDASFNIRASVQAFAQQATAAASVSAGIGINSTTTNSAQKTGSAVASGGYVSAIGEYVGYAPLGLVALNWLEYSSAATTTWGGTNASINRYPGLSAEVLM